MRPARRPLRAACGGRIVPDTDDLAPAQFRLGLDMDPVVAAR
jgi:hypothetical protein